MDMDAPDRRSVLQSLSLLAASGTLAGTSDAAEAADQVDDPNAAQALSSVSDDGGIILVGPNEDAHEAIEEAPRGAVVLFTTPEYYPLRNPTVPPRVTLTGARAKLFKSAEGPILTYTSRNQIHNLILDGNDGRYGGDGVVQAETPNRRHVWSHVNIRGVEGDGLVLFEPARCTFNELIVQGCGGYAVRTESGSGFNQGDNPRYVRMESSEFRDVGGGFNLEGGIRNSTLDVRMQSVDGPGYHVTDDITDVTIRSFLRTAGPAMLVDSPDVSQFRVTFDDAWVRSCLYDGAPDDLTDPVGQIHFEEYDGRERKHVTFDGGIYGNSDGPENVTINDTTGKNEVKLAIRGGESATGEIRNVWYWCDDLSAWDDTDFSEALDGFGYVWDVQGVQKPYFQEKNGFRRYFGTSVGDLPEGDNWITTLVGDGPPSIRLNLEGTEYELPFERVS